MAMPALRMASNSSGVHQRATGRWRRLGRMYWPTVTMSPYRPQIGQSGENLVRPLSHPQDDPRLGSEAGILGPGQHPEAPSVAGRGADRPLHTGHRLDVVVEDVGPCVEHGGQRRSVALAVGDENLDGRTGGAASDGRDDLGEAAGPSVVQIVAGHTGDDGVGQTQPGHRLGHPDRLVRIERPRPGRPDLAEPAGPGAVGPIDHEGGRPVGPALVDVGAPGLLAHRDQIEIAHVCGVRGRNRPWWH